MVKKVDFNVLPIHPQLKKLGYSWWNFSINDANKLKDRYTKDITDSTSAHKGAYNYGLEYSVKTFDSLKRKVSQDCDKQYISPEDAVSKIYDTNRYTAIVTIENNFTKGYFNIVNSLEQKGYELYRVKNSFGDQEKTYWGG